MSEETIHGAEINDNLIWKSNRFSLGKKKKNTKSKHLSFSCSTNIQFNISEQFLQFKACKSGEIDTIRIEVAQQY